MLQRNLWKSQKLNADLLNTNTVFYPKDYHFSLNPEFFWVIKKRGGGARQLQNSNTVGEEKTLNPLMYLWKTSSVA